MGASFMAGGLRVDRLVESEGPFLDAFNLFPAMPRETLEAQRAALEAQGALVAGSDVLVLAVQSYVVRTPHHVVMIDTCVGADKERPHWPHQAQLAARRYEAALASAGLGFGDVDVVLCTHLHIDHVGWNTRAEGGRWVPTFPKARYVFGAGDFAYFEGQHATRANPVFADSVLPIVEAGRADLVASDHAIDDHVRLIATPGHTPGHVAVLIGKGRDDAMMTGDLIHTPLQLADPGLSPRFDLDPLAAAATRRAVLERLCDTDTLCCPAHFPSPSAGRIRRAGAGFRCEFVA